MSEETMACPACGSPGQWVHDRRPQDDADCADFGCEDRTHGVWRFEARSLLSEAHTHELKIGAREYDPDGVVQTWQMYCVGCDQAGRFTIPDEEKDWIEPERERASDPLDVAWKEVADAVVDRPYPGTDINDGWCIQLFGYPPTSIGGTPETRYHAMATPAIDSHHRNTVKATGPTPSAALQALLTALSSQSPVGAERTPTATSEADDVPG